MTTGQERKKMRVQKEKKNSKNKRVLKLNSKIQTKKGKNEFLLNIEWN